MTARPLHGRKGTYVLHGQRKTLDQWAAHYDVSRGCVYKRLARGMTLEQALTTRVLPTSEASRAGHLSRKAPPGRKRTKEQPISGEEAWEGANKRPFRDDVVAQILFNARGGDYTLDEVGLMLGISRERVRQIEKQAYGKYVRELAKLGLSREQVVDALRTREALRARRERVYPAPLLQGECLDPTDGRNRENRNRKRAA